MSSNLYSIGLSGLQSSNARINTTSQNTSNVDTEGYSRQRTDTASSALGGVVLRDTFRLVDNFVSAQVRSDTSEFAYYDALHSMMTASDNLLSEQNVALTGYLDKAFGALQAANNDPTSSSLRELAHSSFKDLVNQYKTLSSIVTRQEDLVDEQISSSLTEVNAIADKISDLNAKISREEGASFASANELRDQQEQLAKDLSEFLSIKTQFNDKGLMNIHLSNGQPLVMDNAPTEVFVRPNELNPKQVELAVNFGDHNVGLKMEGLGGSVGGLVDYRSEFSSYADRTLGQSAIAISDAMNAQNAKGLDANGHFGKDIFSLANIEVYTASDSARKSSAVEVRVSQGEAAKITKDTYELVKVDDQMFSINRYDLNNRPVGQPVLLDPSATALTSDGYYKLDALGLDIKLSDLNAIENGDVFRFVPTQGAASKLGLFAKNGDDIALSSPIGVVTHSSNLSNAKISVSEITSTRPDASAFSADGSLYPSSPHSIYFTSPNSYVVRDSSGSDVAAVDNVLQYNNLLEQAGLSIKAGFDVSISSTPRAGDEFSMSPDEVGVADNLNGLALMNLQNQSLVEGKASLTKAFAGFIAHVGVEAAEAKGHAASSEVVLNDSTNRRDRLSAVNLDEEAVNLMKYQQSYSASAQVITAARTTFETLLGIMR
ncbi:flagellar hook-associated protein FlgK [Marinomonas sp. IMCC 4694]|uniref:flagellar hook-associated protein FlgK n=1 Tax=Marinomonas sp. IMCC 4694 TaxID=2605432 RepID=UPI0011E7B1F0|nr:flagellar hook-associated protein FlgK [Marinomonas sp. IMCC 4694]TYL47143.1 flagellar hook-associated protein FlgK [Marinomonas sp. IMCC 4694]